MAPGCQRAVIVGRVACIDHHRSEQGRALQAAVGKAARDAMEAVEEGNSRGAGARAFERRVARGDYGALFDEPLRRVMHQASAVDGVTEEIGALRFVLARVLVEEEDPARQAMRWRGWRTRRCGRSARSRPWQTMGAMR